MRIKRGKVKKAKHKKVLKQNKGYLLSYSKLYRRALEARLHAGQYNFNDRKKRQGQFRKIWIKQINAICKQNGTSYSRFMNYLKKENVIINKKILAYITVNNPAAIKPLIEKSLS